jgi:hypothetical protein
MPTQGKSPRLQKNPPKSGRDQSGYIKGKYYMVNGKVMLWNGHQFVDPLGGQQPPGNGNTSLSGSGGSSGGGGGTAGPAVRTITGRKLSQAQVDALKADFSHIAQMYGVNLGGGALDHAVRMDLSSSEFLQRVQVIQRIKENQTFFQQFAGVLKDQGIKEGRLSFNEQKDIILGQAPAKFYQAWEHASVRAGLVSSGLSFSRKGPGQGYTSVGHAFVNQLIGAIGRDKILSGSPTINDIYSKVANDLLNVLPESAYQNFNLSKSDIIQLEAGGPHSLALAQKVRQLQANAAGRDREAQNALPNPQDQSGYTPGSL